VTGSDKVCPFMTSEYHRVTRVGFKTSVTSFKVSQKSSDLMRSPIVLNYIGKPSVTCQINIEIQNRNDKSILNYRTEQSNSEIQNRNLKSMLKYKTEMTL